MPVSSDFQVDLARDTENMIQISDLLAQITGEPSPTAPTQTIPPLLKRKPDEQLRKPVDKLQRTGTPAGGSSRPPTQVSTQAAVNTSLAKMKLGQNGQPSLQSPTANFKNGQPTPPPQTEPAKPPKKGSYAEIMARGKAAQATLGQVGKIQHKKIEKLPSKREREEMKATKIHNLQKNLGPNGKFRAAGKQLLKDERTGAGNSERKVSNGKVGTVGTGKKSAEAVAERKIKKAAIATTGYTGTARPKPGAKVSRPSTTGSSRYDRGPDRGRDGRYGTSSKGYSYHSEEEDEDEEDEEVEDYASDVSSDMEAAAFEVDEEEEEAARIARREDAEALAEENRHKREKEEKRRRLMALAKSRR
jgi:protein SPT2